MRSGTVAVLGAFAFTAGIVFAGLLRGPGETVQEPVFPDDLEVIVEITPDIPDLYSRCVAVLHVAQVPTRVCEGLVGR